MGWSDFFFQAEDGIRVGHVTGVQTCALPIFRGPEDDAAGDGIPNLVKFALGLDPLTPSRDGLPRTEIVSDNGEARLAIIGQIFNDAADVTVEPQVSNDLISWDPLEAEPEIIEVVGDITIIRVVDTETIDGNSRRFLRLNVIQN